MKDDPDRELVEDCLSPDKRVRDRAFTSLFEKYKDKVYTTAYRITGESSLAYDATQETFLSVYRKIGDFNREARFSSWLYRIAFNFSIDRKRKASKEPLLHEEAGSPSGRTEWDIVDERAVDPESVASSKEFESRVQGVIDRISEPLRVVVVLRYVNGLSYKEIGEVLGCSIGTVKSRLNRAMAALEAPLGRLLQQEAGEE